MSGRYRGGGGDGDYYGRGGPPPPHDRRGGGYGNNNNYGPPPDRRGVPPPRYHDHHRGPPRYDHRGGGGGHRGRGPPPPRRMKPGPISFQNFEEERKWVEDRRRKRKERPSKFDIVGNGTGALLSQAGASNEPQQTRHARRLYVGNLPPTVTEDQIHTAFTNAVRETMAEEDKAVYDPKEDPILTVYINFERGFSFIEFKSVEICSACMALDGLEIVPGYPVKVKRPNDYNPASAPMTTRVPILNVSQLGIIAPTVLDSPNKIFIGGLHYHFTESQVLELLGAFGKIKAFHLVKGDPEAPLSKGYCFVEYLDSAVTPVAVAGLNGMEIGDGKQLTARVAGERDATSTPHGTANAALPPDAATAPPAGRTIVAGYDIELLVDAALGHKNMPHGPTYIDPATGIPITRIVGGAMAVPASLPPPPPAAVAAPLTNDALRSVLASVKAAPAQETRVLVLLNMVTDDDLQTTEDHQALVEEVRGECAKYGHLLSVVIPRVAKPPAQPSAVRKVFLEYDTVATARIACGELDGRQFGDARVQTEYLPENDFAAGALR